MIINIIEEIEAKSTDALLSHDCFIEDPGEDVADDGAGVVHRPLDRHQLVHLLLAHLGPVPPADGQLSSSGHDELPRLEVKITEFRGFPLTWVQE